MSARLPCIRASSRPRRATARGRASLRAWPSTQHARSEIASARSICIESSDSARPSYGGAATQRNDDAQPDAIPSQDCRVAGARLARLPLRVHKQFCVNCFCCACGSRGGRPCRGCCIVNLCGNSLYRRQRAATCLPGRAVLELRWPRAVLELVYHLRLRVVAPMHCDAVVDRVPRA